MISDKNNGNFFKQELQILKHTTCAQFTFPMNPVVPNSPFPWILSLLGKIKQVTKRGTLHFMYNSKLWGLQISIKIKYVNFKNTQSISTLVPLDNF